MPSLRLSETVELIREGANAPWGLDLHALFAVGVGGHFASGRALKETAGCHGVPAEFGLDQKREVEASLGLHLDGSCAGRQECLQGVQAPVAIVMSLRRTIRSTADLVRAGVYQRQVVLP